MPTYEQINEAVAEPVVYMIDRRYVVGGFYRVHADRGIDENLNAPGASFVPLAFAEPMQMPKPGSRPGVSAPNRFYMYGCWGAWPCSRPAMNWKRQIRTPKPTDWRSGAEQGQNSPLADSSTNQSVHSSNASLSGRQLAALTLGAIGIVYGDIGTSPLYALKEVFAHGHLP